ncbi:DUF4124 domain-containing protein [Marinobacter sp. C2H3]|uniref:DUF4124 domain-containing protein n=1 Tax=Marinobacter sp. C2H3 TaxID=3119003 RepID=UPI00300F115F
MGVSMKTKLLLLALLAASVPTLSQAASVFKWTDENGVTHFGDRQPDDGRKAQKVDVRVGTGAGKPAATPSPQAKVEDMEKAQADQASTAREKAQEEARQKLRAANCETAKSNLSIIDSNARIRMEKDGEMRYLTPEEIANQKATFQKIADENCGPEKSQPAAQ